MAQQQPPPGPGWYPDPAGGGGQRYWDGTAWGPVAPPPQPPPPPRRSSVWPAFLAGVSPALLIVGLPLLCCGSCGVLGLIGALSDHGTSSSNQSTVTTTQAYTAAPPTSIDKRSDYLSTLTSEGIRVDDQTAMDLGEKVCMELKMGMDDGEIEQSLRTQAAITTHTAHIFLITARSRLC